MVSKIAVFTCTDIPNVKFRSSQLTGIQLQTVYNGLILSYVAIDNFERFLVNHPRMSQFSVRLEPAIAEIFMEDLIDF